MEQDDLSRRLWRRYLVAVTALIVIAVGVVLLVLHFNSPNKVSSKQTCNSNCEAKKPSPAPNNTKPAKTPASNNTVAQAPKSNPSTEPATTQLSDTGPGNVVTLFLSTTVISSLLYSARLRRKTH